MGEVLDLGSITWYRSRGLLTINHHDTLALQCSLSIVDWLVMCM